MKNKKIIALVCALSMVFSMLTSFTVVNAAEQGIALEIEQTTATKAVITAKAVGYPKGISGSKIAISVPEGATVEVSCPMKSDALVNTSKPGEASCTIGLTDNTPVPNDVLAIFTVTMTEALPKNFKSELVAGSQIAAYANDTDEEPTLISVEDGNLDITSVVIKADPNKEEITPIDKPTYDPDVTEPSPKDPEVVVGEQGIDLDVAKSGKVITVTAKAVGYPKGISGSKIAISVPEGATVEVSCPMKSDALVNTSKPGEASCTIGLTDNTPVPNDVLAIFTITLGEDLTEDFKCELVTGSQIAAYANDTDEEPTLISVEDGNLNPVSKWIEASPFTGTTVALSEKLSKDTASELIADTENVKDVYVAYEAKKGNSAAEYGSDYTAYYDGTKLTNDQLNAYLTGKFGSVADAIEKITFTYKSGVALNVQLVSVNTENEAEVAESGTIGGGKPQPTQKPTPTPTAGVKVTADKTEISSDGSTRVNAVVTDAEGATPGSEVKFTVSSGADVLDFDGATEATVALADNKASVRVYAKKVGTATVKAAYTYTDKDGAEQTKEGTVTIRVKNTSISGGSDGDNKKPSSGGPIAGPSDSINNGTNWLGAFTDLDSVEWAKPSILALSLKGIVSGRGDGTFAPNDNITRAEYCQILIGAIEKSAEYADSEFADVPSDAWFYHAVSVASKYGIVSGYGDGNFGPYDLITRQDMALMTYKAAQVMNKNLSAVRTMSFTDAGAISAYAAEAVQTLADASIINGVSDTEFAPQANATRAQAAKILYDTFVKVN